MGVGFLKIMKLFNLKLASNVQFVIKKKQLETNSSSWQLLVRLSLC